MDDVYPFHMKIKVRRSFRPVRTRADWALKGQRSRSDMFDGAVLVELLFGRPPASTIRFPTLPEQILTISPVGNECKSLVGVFLLLKILVGL
jgi:hypothetical protein